jgi:hypothetical protein
VHDAGASATPALGEALAGARRTGHVAVSGLVAKCAVCTRVAVTRRDRQTAGNIASEGEGLAQTQTENFVNGRVTPIVQEEPHPAYTPRIDKTAVAARPAKCTCPHVTPLSTICVPKSIPSMKWATAQRHWAGLWIVDRTICHKVSKYLAGF